MVYRQSVTRTITIQHFEGCPNVQLAQERVSEALRRVGGEEWVVQLQEIVDAEDAERNDFRGSPTVLVDGVDLFADPATPVGFACRVYTTPVGREAAPSVDQLCDVLR
jgi:hypothetical protein